MCDDGSVEKNSCKESRIERLNERKQTENIERDYITDIKTNTLKDIFCQKFLNKELPLLYNFYSN